MHGEDHLASLKKIAAKSMLPAAEERQKALI
jgi:hypothetical protein